MLAVTKKFLDSFDSGCWQILQDSRLAVLRCHGAQGDLDIFVIYASAKDSSERWETFKRIPQYTRPRDQALSLFLGDFNYVEETGDRFCLAAGRHTGDGDSVEARTVYSSVWRLVGGGPF